MRKNRLWLIFMLISGLMAFSFVIVTGEEKVQKLDDNTLAIVNGSKITQDFFAKKYKSLSEDYQKVFQNDQEGFLEQLITGELLYQEAAKNGFDKVAVGNKDPEESKDVAILSLITDLTNKVTVTDPEIREFYNSHPTEVNGATYEKAKASIKDYLFSQKQNDALDELISNLTKKAIIVKNQQWLDKQAAAKPKNPLTEALQSGQPTVLDLGSGSCIPCKMMKPILDELEKTYKGKANILLLDINDYRDVANQYQVRVIPTQVFFDKAGKQVLRHEGFLAKAEIVKQLKSLGVE
jgi:thioredoxin 1